MQTDSSMNAAFSGRVGSFVLNANFTVPMRGVTALFGPSGSGKTTLLRAIAGLEKLDGSLTVQGDVWQNSSESVFLPPHLRRTGYVFQEASLFPHMSVRDNLLYGAKRSSKKIFRFDDVVSLLGINTLMDRPISALSGGERQRIAVGRALLSNPRILLMDEPLSALDYHSRQEVLAYLETLHKSLSIPILYVSHDFTEVTRLADHMVLLKNGEKIAEGPAASLVEQLDFMPPEGRHETSVLLTAHVSAHKPEFGATELSLGAQHVTVPSIHAEIGEAVRLRIRARDVALATKRPEAISIRNILEGTILDIRDSTPTFCDILFDVNGHHIRAQVTKDAVHDLGIEKGAAIYALIKSMSFDSMA